MRSFKQYQMQFATVASFVAVVAIPLGARSADAPPSQQSSKPASNHAGNPKSAVRAPSVRDHLQLQPVTSEQFKAAAKPSKKPATPSVRDHLNLQPLTSDDFKAGEKADRKAVAPLPAAR